MLEGKRVADGATEDVPGRDRHIEDPHNRRHDQPDRVNQKRVQRELFKSRRHEPVARESEFRHPAVTVTRRPGPAQPRRQPIQRQGGRHEQPGTRP